MPPKGVHRRPSTVLHLIESLGRGGAERRLVNDLRYLDRQFFNHLVCTLHPPHDLEDEVRALDVPVHCLGASSLRALIPSVRRLWSLLARHHVHILHTQLFPADLLGRMSRLVRWTPVLITTLQSSVYEPGTEYLYSKRMRFVDSITGRMMNDAFVAVSAFVRDSAVQNLGLSPDRVTVIYNSVDPSSLRDPDLHRVGELWREVGIKPGDPVLLVIGRLDPPKGHRFLFPALAEIRRSFPTVKLLVVGDGPSRFSLERLSRELDLSENVVFTGTRSDVRELLSLADVFVLPTLSEGLPVTLIEALAAGVPAVVSRIGPTEEVIADGMTGLLVPPRSPDALVTAILRLLNHPAEARAMGDRGQTLANEKFSARRSAEALTHLYETLVAANVG